MESFNISDREYDYVVNMRSSAGYAETKADLMFAISRAIEEKEMEISKLKRIKAKVQEG